MVFDRRSAKRQTVFALKKAGCLGRLGPGILYRLCFIKDNEVEFCIVEMQRVPPQRSVSCQHKVVILEMLACLRTFNPSVSQNAKLRCKLLRFCFPVKNQGAWNNYERGPWQSIRVIGRRSSNRLASSLFWRPIRMLSYFEL